MNFVVYVFSKLQTVKGVVTQMSNETRLRASFYGKETKTSQTLEGTFIKLFFHSVGN